jgi:Na+-driven multidrug efflux pump
MHPQDGNAPAPGSLRELLRVAVPLVLSSGSVTLMLTIDRIFSWSSTDEFAAAGRHDALTVMSLVMVPWVCQLIRRQ